MEKTNQAQLVPFFDRLFVKRDETVERTRGGVIIPDSDKEKPNRGTVVSTGPNCEFAFEGQRIIFGQHNGFEIMIGGEELTVLREQDIYAGDPPKITNSDIKPIEFTDEEKRAIGNAFKK